MEKTKNRKRINELVEMINNIKARLQAKKDAGIVRDKNGWFDECAQRDAYAMKQEVNKLAGIKIY